MLDEIKVVELFAGVGGFRLGLEAASERFNTIWSNQWEPSTKVQHASEIYVKKFGPVGHCNKNISDVPTSDIPDHDMLVGGFPCQDYSVARTLNHAKGLKGKKGVLWWEIERILSEKKVKPKFVFLENVDRLLKSPVNQRGRDFAIMLASLSDLGYVVEWRVINAADYGMPQRRRRIFIFGFHKSTKLYSDFMASESPEDWISSDGVFASAFPITVSDSESHTRLKIDGELEHISENFNRLSGSYEGDLSDPLSFVRRKTSTSPFENSGVVVERDVFTLHAEPNYTGEFTTLDDVLVTDREIPLEYFITSESLERWAYLKGPKNEKRVNKATGFEYEYNEGSMVFPDARDKPSRTIITGEGGATPSRFKHVIKDDDGHLRRLLPVELERLNMFPDDHTAGVSDVKRAFFMGNALVVGIVQQVGGILVNMLGRETATRKINAALARK